MYHHDGENRGKSEDGEHGSVPDYGTWRWYCRFWLREECYRTPHFGPLSVSTPSGSGSVKYQDDKHLFRFGNGTIETSKQSVELPVGIGGRRGSLHASVLDGKAEEAPLLVSKPALRSLGAVLDFENSVLQLKRIGTDVELKEGPTGHYLLDLFQFPVLIVSKNVENDAPEILPDELVKKNSTINDSENTLVVTDTEAIQESPTRRPLSMTPTLRCWTRVDDNCLTLRATRLDGPPWSSVRERETFDADTGETIETRRSIMDLTRRQRRAQIDRLRRLETRLYYDPSAIADEKTRRTLQESELMVCATQENCVVMSRRLKCRIKRQCSEALFWRARKANNHCRDVFPTRHGLGSYAQRRCVTWCL